MTASLYARINALTAELRTLRQDNERLRQHNQELIAQTHERRSVELPSPFDVFTPTEACLCGHGRRAHRDGARACLGGTGHCICSRFSARSA